MNKYRVFKIENKDGKVISNHNSYSSLGNAKKAANNCIWKMDENTNIVEYEITEVPIKKTKVNVKITTSTRTDYRGNQVPITHRIITGYDEDAETKNKELRTEGIIFNQDTTC